MRAGFGGNIYDNYCDFDKVFSSKVVVAASLVTLISRNQNMLKFY